MEKLKTNAKQNRTLCTDAIRRAAMNPPAASGISTLERPVVCSAPSTHVHTGISRSSSVSARFPRKFRAPAPPHPDRAPRAACATLHVPHTLQAHARCTPLASSTPRRRPHPRTMLMTLLGLVPDRRTDSSDTANSTVAFGGTSGGFPRDPYAYSGGTTSSRWPPTFMPSMPVCEQDDHRRGGMCRPVAGG